MKKLLVYGILVFVALLITSSHSAYAIVGQTTNTNSFFKSVVSIPIKNFNAKVQNIIIQKSNLPTVSSTYQKYVKKGVLTLDPKAYCPNGESEETVERNGCGPHRTIGGSPRPNPGGGVDGPCQNGYKTTIYPDGRIINSPCTSGGLTNPLDGTGVGVGNIDSWPPGAHPPYGQQPASGIGVTVTVPIGQEPPITTAPETAAQAAKRRAKERAEACLADPSACGSGSTNINTYNRATISIPGGPTYIINTNVK